MAIKPYISKTTVTPAVSFNTAGIVKAGSIQASSMLGAARVMDKIGDLAFEEGKEVRTREGMESGASYKLMRDETGQVIAPNDLPPQDTFFNEGYRKSVLTKYTNDLQLDVSRTLQDLSLKHRFKPEEFQEVSTNYLRATFESVDPAVRNDVERYAGERQRQHYSALSNQHQNRVDNQTVRSTELLIDQSRNELRNHVLSGSKDMEAYTSAFNTWTDNLNKLLPYIGEDNVNIRKAAVERSLGAMHFFKGYTELSDVERAKVSKQLAAGKGKIFNENPTLMAMNAEERQNLALFANRFDREVKGLEAEELEISKNIVAGDLMAINLARLPTKTQDDWKSLIGKLSPKAKAEWEKFPKVHQFSQFMAEIGRMNQTANQKYRDTQRNLQEAKQLQSKNLFIESNLVLRKALAGYEDERDRVIEVLKNNNITDPQIINGYLRSTLQVAMKANKDVITTRLVNSTKAEIKTLSKQLKLDATQFLGDNFHNPDINQVYRYVSDKVVKLRQAAQAQQKLHRELGPYLSAHNHNYSMVPGKANGKYVIQALKHLGVENSSHPDTWLANVNLGIPDEGVSMMIQATQGSGSFDPKVLEQSVSLFSSYYNRGGDKHLRAQLGSKTYLQLAQISRLGKEDGFGSKETLTAVQNILKDKGDPYDQVKRALGSDYINEDGSLNYHEIDKTLNSDWESVAEKYVDGEGNDWMDKALRAFKGGKFAADVGVDVSTPKELTFASAPNDFRIAVRDKWMTNIQTFTGDSAIDDDDRQSALLSAIEDTLKSQNLGNWGWTLYAAPSGEFNSGDFRLRRDAVESHFWVPSPTDIGGRSTVWIGPAAMEEFKKQLPKKHKEPIDGYKWGTNIYLDRSGKYNKQTGKPIYFVRANDDEGLGGLIYNKGRPIEIDLSPRLDKEIATGVMDLVSHQWNEQQRLREQAKVFQKQEAERKQRIRGAAKLGVKSDLSRRPTQPPIPGIY